MTKGITVRTYEGSDLYENATDFDADGVLTVYRGDDPVAAYQKDSWSSVIDHNVNDAVSAEAEPLVFNEGDAEPDRGLVLGDPDGDEWRFGMTGSGVIGWYWNHWAYGWEHAVKVFGPLTEVFE